MNIEVCTQEYRSLSLLTFRTNFHKMFNSLCLSTWNIHGIFHNVRGDKTKIKVFTNNIMKTDLMFLTETWSDREINIPGFKAFVSDPTTPHTGRARRLSGGITLLVKIKYEKHVSIVKKTKNYIWCEVSKTFLTIIETYFSVVHIYHHKNHSILTKKFFTN